MRPRALLLALALLAAGREVAAQQVSVTVLDYGIYEAGLKVERPATSSAGPYATAKNICRVMRTQIIPIEEGTLFGFAFRLEGDTPDKSVEIRQKVRFPKRSGDGTLDTMERTVNRPFGGTSYMGWQNDGESKPGLWIVELFHHDRKLTELRFKVTDDKNFRVVPDGDSKCFPVSERQRPAGTHVAQY